MQDETVTPMSPSGGGRDPIPGEHPPTVLAVDAGGTSTRAGWFTGHGHCLGLARADGSNPVSRGADAALSQLVSAMSRAAGPGGWRAMPRPPRLVLVAMAGGSRAEIALLRRAMAGVGLPGEPVLASDLLAGYFSGASEPDGYGLVAGTGAAAIRVVAGVERAVADGVGWLLGDRGSGYWIGSRAVRAAMRALDRGEPSLLANAVLAAQGLSADEPGAARVAGRHPAIVPLVNAFYGAAPVDLARFAPVALAAAAAGDRTAGEIVEQAVSELVATLDSVLDPAFPGPIVVHGGVAAVLPGLTAALRSLQRAQGWPADVRESEHGLLGAAVLALRAAGLEVSERTRSELAAGIAGTAGTAGTADGDNNRDPTASTAPTAPTGRSACR